MRVLIPGSEGKDVRRWQLFLMGQGFAPLAISGTFDAPTVQATRAFQARYKLDVDGKVGLMDRVLAWGGSYAPRFIRGSTSVLSNHAFGSAFDINVANNPLGAEPAYPTQKGCVFDLVPLAHEHGFYWGGHFASRRDGMHFEIAEIG